jgi:hypothetical protein
MLSRRGQVTDANTLEQLVAFVFAILDVKRRVF